MVNSNISSIVLINEESPGNGDVSPPSLFILKQASSQVFLSIELRTTLAPLRASCLAIS